MRYLFLIYLAFTMVTLSRVKNRAPSQNSNRKIGASPLREEGVPQSLNFGICNDLANKKRYLLGHFHSPTDDPLPI